MFFELNVYYLNTDKYLQKFITKEIHTKSKTIGFKGEHPIITIIVLDHHTLEQVCHFNYLGCYISFGNDIDWHNKLGKFRSMYVERV